MLPFNPIIHKLIYGSAFCAFSAAYSLNKTMAFYDFYIIVKLPLVCSGIKFIFFCNGQRKIKKVFSLQAFHFRVNLSGFLLAVILGFHVDI